MIGIYKITNQINKKHYIGQSTNIEKRWNAHRSAARNPKNRSHNTSHLYRAMRKYGFENFTFEVLEECPVAMLNQKEREYIQKYNSCFDGYNESLGGDCGRHTPKETIMQIIHDLETTDLSQSEIAAKNHVTTKWVQMINTGRAWKHDRPYPIRQYTKPALHPDVIAYRQQHNDYAKSKICIDCGAIIYRGSTRCTSCEANRKAAKLGIYKPSKEELRDALMQHHTFSNIARIYNVSRTLVRKWCRSYNMPDSSKAYAPLKKSTQHYIRMPVAMCDKTTGEVIQVFSSAAAAEIHCVGKRTGAVKRVLNGGRPSAYGYQWKYADNNT